jgi:hypothetical protein
VSIAVRQGTDCEGGNRARANRQGLKKNALAVPSSKLP